jgi:hypothetical protein
MKIETPMTASAIAELKSLGLRFNALDHDPERRAINAQVIEFCESIHINWVDISFFAIDNQDESHEVKIPNSVLEGKRSFEEYWKTQRELDEYDYEYDEYVEAKETYERLREKYE